MLWILALARTVMTPDIQSLITDIAATGLLDRRYNWSVFRMFNFYRMLLAAVLLAVFLLQEPNRFVGQTDPDLFLATTALYMTLLLLFIAASYRRRPVLHLQAHILTGVDLVCLTLLIHASGGIDGNLSLLMVTVVAASGILLPLYSALAAAALAFFLLAGDWLYTSLEIYLRQENVITVEGLGHIWNYLQSYSSQFGRLGVLGGSCFIAVLLTYTLAERARRSETLARQRSRQLLQMANLNQAIIQQLQSGIIVVDQSGRIRMMNDTAYRLLDCRQPAPGAVLEDLSPSLRRRFDYWRDSGVNSVRPFRQATHLPALTARCTPLSGNQATDILIFLEDSSLVAQRLQQLKLAALGRMTAGIAHEIRNPLASISHAAQLLQEDVGVGDGVRRLGQIIHDNTKRANKIITNVLELSRRERAKPKNFPLAPWLEEFCREFQRSQRQPPQLDFSVQADGLEVYFDPVYLHQTLWNLCHNACVHGAPAGQTPRLRLTAGVESPSGKPFLEVRDFGPGIPESDVSKIFEPFFTTGAGGTGLGLYIAREICEANSAQLQYIRPPDGGSCFCINFAKVTQPDEERTWITATP